jgi:hypothetical protein
MIKKLSIFGVVLLALGMLTFPAGAWVFVPDFGDTGWQTYTYTAGPGGFRGFAGFVVSNQGDTNVDSTLLLDNLSHCSLQADNKGFELGTYNGFGLSPTAYLFPDNLTGSFGIITSGPVIAQSLIEYFPTQGSLMSQQDSFNTDTSSFLNYFGAPGTNGSILETFISLAEGETFSFDWAFLTNNHLPFRDFSKFFLIDCENGQIVFEDGLGQVVPLPSTLLMMASGLLGVGGWSWRRKKLA